MALTGDDGLVIGCRQENDITGALYYYKRPDSAIRYVFKQKLVASDGVPGNLLGMLN